MKCPKCSKLVPDSASFCPSCGSPTPQPMQSSGPSPSEITPDWLAGVLRQGGYEVSPSDKDPNALRAKHHSRINVLMTIRRNLGLITVQHWWGLNKPGWGGDKDLRMAINAANSSSWFDTFSLDKDGDLNVSAYITLTHALTAQDILDFLERESNSFFAILTTSGLRQFVK